MKIKLITLLSGPGGTHQPGAELDTEAGEIDKKQAQDLVDGGYAIELKTRRVEKAIAPKGEHAVPVTTAEEDARKNLAAIAEAEAAAKTATPEKADPASGDEHGSNEGGDKPHGMLGRMMNKIRK